MKNLSIIVILAALLSQSCRKPIVYTRDPGTSSNNAGPLTYAQINGNYRLYDSIYFIGNDANQPLHAEYRHVISRSMPVTIDEKSTPAASLTYNGQLYYEGNHVPNDYMTTDKYYDIQRIQFSKDTVTINYFKREFRNDSSLNITVKGYKLK